VKGESPFSEHFECKFIIADRVYSSVVQWKMQQKSMTFGHYDLAERIMQMSDSKAMKMAGRDIPNFDQSTWDEYSYDIVYIGNTQKFAQNVELYLALKATVGITLVGANSYDRSLGCGLQSTELEAQNRETWMG